MSTKYKKYNVSEEQIIEAIKKSTNMSEAARLVNMPFMTFRKKSQKLGLYKPNQSRKGVKRLSSEYKQVTIPLDEILNGLHPFYKTYNLKNRLIKEGLKSEKCEGENCNVNSIWNGKLLKLHLDHIDGNSENHKLNNLRILCPNCHSQTDTYAGKNVIKNIHNPFNCPVLKIDIEKIYNSYKNKTTKLVKIELKQLKYVKLVENSNINFDKFGWVNEVATVINCKPQKVNIWMKKYMLDFYNKKCFKRKMK